MRTILAAPAMSARTARMGANPSRILIIRPSALGDVCRTVPVLVSLRAAFPQAQIDWLVQDAFADAIRAHPALSNVVPFPRRALQPFWNPAVAAKAISWMNHALRAPRYELVVDCQGLARSGLFAWWTRAPRRVGSRHAAERAWLGYTARHPSGDSLHVVDRMLHLLECEGIPVIRDMRLYAPNEAETWWNAAPERPAGRYAVFAPTTRWPSKQWPAERWAELAAQVLGRAEGSAEGDAAGSSAAPRGVEHIVYVGAPAEADAVRAAMPQHAGLAMRCVDLAGKTSVGGLMAVIRSAGLVVANDSAALHMAVGFARPYVALFGPTDPAENGPYGGKEWVVKGDFAECEPPLHYRDQRLGDRLMRRVAVKQVAQKVRLALEQA